ncbi:MAG: VWA domain-containing protein [Bryobacterales bacterium]|nr:VWA domain-containing protein [Bryobacterales bacterium]
MKAMTVGLAAIAICAGAAEDEVIFRSDVSLVRVDVQVMDSRREAVTGLDRENFVLRESGRVREIRNFAAEKMPVDILLLLDVSGSMRPHLEQVARASRGALSVLGADDRVGVMVFDRATRLRSGFRPQPREAAGELDRLLDQERFNGGTDITLAMLDAARYVEREARPEARRAIVIVTDDRTEFERDDARVGRALDRADAVLSVLLADAIEPGYSRGGQYPRTRRPGGGWPGGGWPGGGWPGGGWPGGGWPGGGPVILGPRGGGGGGASGRLQSAGVEEIARESGGDSLRLDDGAAVERTLQRIRSRYALYFLLPDDAREGESRSVDVQLSERTAARYPGAEVRLRHRYVVPSLGPRSTPAEITRTTEPAASGPAPAATASADAASEGGFRRATQAEIEESARQQETASRRKRRVSEPGASRGPNPSVGVPDRWN